MEKKVWENEKKHKILQFFFVKIKNFAQSQQNFAPLQDGEPEHHVAVSKAKQSTSYQSPVEEKRV